ncbi:TrmH family RNA methyltransferase [Patescibacteria group bacterium]|nr:TrmH family RNA methyltransferase [Patescibacteria group bacterium]
MVLNAQKLRNLEPQTAEKFRKNRKTQDIYIILDNVLDTYNIGGFFRLADAIGAKCVYLCGDCATPPNHRIVKASVGTFQLVTWKYRANVLEVITELRSLGAAVVAVEQTEGALDYRQTKYQRPTAFVFGNESYGLSEEILQVVDKSVEIPMYGFNKSLNVMVAAGLVLYEALNSFPNLPVRPSILARLLPYRRAGV